MHQKRNVVCCLYCQYELVAELFHEDGDATPTATSGGKAKSTGAVVRASKVAQKSTQQLRQHKKTVGSQVSIDCYCIYRVVRETVEHTTTCFITIWTWCLTWPPFTVLVKASHYWNCLDCLIYVVHRCFAPSCTLQQSTIFTIILSYWSLLAKLILCLSDELRELLLVFIPSDLAAELAFCNNANMLSYCWAYQQ